jgi:hypothetical protein
MRQEPPYRQQPKQVTGTKLWQLLLAPKAKESPTSGEKSEARLKGERGQGASMEASMTSTASHKFVSSGQAAVRSNCWGETASGLPVYVH